MSSDLDGLLLSEPSLERLTELAESLRDREQWAVVVGAGLSIDAGYPTWSKFVRDAGHRSGIPIGTIVNPNNYTTLLQQCSDALGEPEFLEYTASVLCEQKASTKPQDLLVRLPVSFFMTTNLDRTLIDAFNEVSSDPCRVVNYPEFLDGPDPDRHTIYHLHGLCCGGEADSPCLDRDNIVFTKTQFGHAYSNESLLRLFLVQVFSRFNVLSVGYSGDDRAVLDQLNRVRQMMDWYRQAGGNPPTWKNFSLFGIDPQDLGEEPHDHAFAGWGDGIEPILYTAPNHDHSALAEILQWLVDRVIGPAPSVEVTES